MPTSFDNPVPRNPPTVRVYRGTPISDVELAQLGVTTPAQRAVFRAIREGEVKHEAEIARRTGMTEMDTCTAIGQLMSASIVRRGQAPLGGLFGPFEIIERKASRKPGAF